MTPAPSIIESARSLRLQADLLSQCAQLTVMYSATVKLQRLPLLAIYLFCNSILSSKVCEKWCVMH